MKIGNLEVYGIIYKITNKINKKVYIGQTTNNKGFNGRYHYNLYKNTKNKHLKSSIKKYGIENFEIIKIFDIAFSKEELDIKEECWINIYDCINNGYNNKGGGARGKLSDEAKEKNRQAHLGKKNGMYGKTYIMKKETKLKLSKINKGKKLSDETKKKISEANKNKTDETKKKISENHADVSGKNNPMYGKKGKLSPRAKVIYCVTTNEIFYSIIDAENKYNIDHSNISKCCRGKQKSAGKLEGGTQLQWMYYEDWLKQYNTKDLDNAI